VIYDLSNMHCCEVERHAKASHKHELEFRNNLLIYGYVHFDLTFFWSEKSTTAVQLVS